MKRLSIITSFILLLLLTACFGGIDHTTIEKESEEKEIQSQGETEDPKIDQDSEKAKESSNKESQGGEVDPVAEERKPDEEEEMTTPIVPTYKINETNWSVEPIDLANEKVVLFTIDDAPDKYGLEMAKLLKEQDVPAIFFVNGHFIDSPKEKLILKQIYELGFSIGNHTWNHKNLKKLTEEEQTKEIILLNDEIEEITGERPKFFRAPFGANTEYARKLVGQEGMVLMNWTYGYDFVKEYMNKDAIGDIMVNTDLLTNGANLLMHDREWTYQALPDIIKGLKEKGYEIVDPKLIETTSQEQKNNESRRTAFIVFVI
jgi:peptidoglycan/xylan/chitin deacetylase (PgdA/CDA1 family)